MEKDDDKKSSMSGETQEIYEVLSKAGVQNRALFEALVLFQTYPLARQKRIYREIKDSLKFKQGK